MKFVDNYCSVLLLCNKSVDFELFRKAKPIYNTQKRFTIWSQNLATMFQRLLK